ncbi:MAG TPA: GNAT family N-acetyltransferase, partial [Kineosporiaceae bacterium]|nr:GNAT family N-acetyltransferase [Kineosporiaceae bacterium]
SQVRQNHRRQITRARRSGLTASIDDWRHLDTFVRIYHETMTRVGAASYYFFDREYFAELRSAVGDALHLVTVEDAGEVLGGGLFFTTGGIAQYHLGATRDRHLPRQPAKLMMDELRRWAKDRGLVALHLGGGVGGRTDDSLFHFKAGFGPGRAAFHTWRVVPDRAVYRLLSDRHTGEAADRCDPDDDSGFFPAYRRGGS